MHIIACHVMIRGCRVALRLLRQTALEKVLVEVLNGMSWVSSLFGAGYSCLIVINAARIFDPEFLFRLSLYFCIALVVNGHCKIFCGCLCAVLDVTSLGLFVKCSWRFGNACGFNLLLMSHCNWFECFWLSSALLKSLDIAFSAADSLRALL